ncbi:MAG: hypothetical protein IJP89_03215 [Synergistaceae bacterium]|nr:hypothetical protein [Synergistaceae bacterium]
MRTGDTENDTEIFSRDDAHNIPITASAFANSSGGRIICEGFSPESFIPHDLPYIPESPNAIYIPPLVWHKRPHVLNGRVYRRVEGVNVISGLRVKSIIARDALEFSRDDSPIENVSLDAECVREFCARVKALHEGLRFCGDDEILRRCGVFSGKFLTLAGAVMLGDMVRVRATLDYSGGHAEIEASNLWRACYDVLPRLTAKLSDKCARAFREIFINALLHSDYTIDTRINIHITSDPPKVLADNPGTIRGATRNHVLRRIFTFAEITHDKLHGLDIVREYMPSFTLEHDMLNLRTLATVKLEGREKLPAPVIL